MFVCLFVFFKTRDLQTRRQQEELSSDLEISVYDIDRNEKSKIYRKLLVKIISHKQKIKIFFLATKSR